ncbi:hypothetical protein MMC06_001049 [Schaereria dolodes]|nr:hypothetical protein [Schaereria dolodes]
MASGSSISAALPNKQTDILDLPPELWEIIHSSASLSTAIALKTACRSFYSCGDALPILYYQARKDRDVRFELLCMAERDQKLRDELTCGACLTTHNIKVFDSHERKAEPTQRSCRGSAGHVEITPEWLIDFNFLISIRRLEWHSTSANQCLISRATAWCYRPFHVRNVHQSLSVSQLWSRDLQGFIRLRNRWSIYLKTLESISTTRTKIGAELSQHLFHLCPHILMSDKRVIKAAFHAHQSLHNKNWLSSLLPFSQDQSRRFICKHCTTVVDVSIVPTFLTNTTPGDILLDNFPQGQASDETLETDRSDCTDRPNPTDLSEGSVRGLILNNSHRAGIRTRESKSYVKQLDKKTRGGSEGRFQWSKVLKRRRRSDSCIWLPHTSGLWRQRYRLSIKVHRVLGRGLSAADPIWISQLSPAREV